MELQLDKILCLALGPYPSTNSMQVYVVYAYWVKKKNNNKRQNRFKIDEIKCDLNIIKYAAKKLKGML